MRTQFCYENKIRVLVTYGTTRETLKKAGRYFKKSESVDGEFQFSCRASRECKIYLHRSFNLRRGKIPKSREFIQKNPRLIVIWIRRIRMFLSLLDTHTDP